MRPAKTFTFINFSLKDSSTVAFRYRVLLNDDSAIDFTELMDFGIEINLSNSNVQRALDALHLALGVSYYKLYAPPMIELKSQTLSEAQAGFWNELYQNGLGEFCYSNKISPDSLAKFKSSDTIKSDVELLHDQSKNNDVSTEVENKKVLLGFGGGKDSIVSGELLKEIGVEVEGFVLENRTKDAYMGEIARIMNVNLHYVERQIDPLLIELNGKPGALNGHIPISSIFAFTGTVLAVLNDSGYVAVGNESSASIPNMAWEGREINHQWSKSFRFETIVQQYIHEHISPNITYFSVIRPLGSVAVCRLMARLPMYFEHFTSCNRVMRMDPARRPKGRWCGECAKCLSTYILLAAWLDASQLDSIFDKKLLEDDRLVPLLLALTGVDGIKPLDCVGTTEEIILSINLLAHNQAWAHTPLINLAREKGILSGTDMSIELREMLIPSSEDALPQEFKDSLMSLMKTGDVS